MESTDLDDHLPPKVRENECVEWFIESAECFGIGFELACASRCAVF
jgi:hypothetical protein